MKKAEKEHITKKQKTSSFFSFWATGKRKTAIAVVNLKEGKGKVVINKNFDLEKYFPSFSEQQIILSPLALFDKTKDFKVSVRVKGGGKRGQAEAIRLGLARALTFFNSDWRTDLRAKGFLTRDARVKERKKPGLKRARRAPQWQKR